mmetsp:Transcript_96453/g.311453  ORF Transcript_96453/g.311453 Transcript_96453/m.311453 type:complete len:207 (+) Transcript_96453:686-1306(+)
MSPSGTGIQACQSSRTASSPVPCSAPSARSSDGAAGNRCSAAAGPEVLPVQASGVAEPPSSRSRAPCQSRKGSSQGFPVNSSASVKQGFTGPVKWMERMRGSCQAARWCSKTWLFTLSRRWSSRAHSGKPARSRGCTPPDGLPTCCARSSSRAKVSSLGARTMRPALKSSPWLLRAPGAPRSREADSSGWSQRSSLFCSMTMSLST